MKVQNLNWKFKKWLLREQKSKDLIRMNALIRLGTNITKTFQIMQWQDFHIMFALNANYLILED